MVKPTFVETLFFLKYFRNEDSWPTTMQTDNLLLKYFGGFGVRTCDFVLF